MAFKDIPYLHSGGYFVLPSQTSCAILVDGIIRNISVQLF